jgi:hypothetical protein
MMGQARLRRLPYQLSEGRLKRAIPATRIAVVVAATVVSWSSAAHADAVDIGWLFTRVGGWKDSPWRAAALLVALIAFDYAFNVVVIVIPAWRSGIAIRRAATDMIGFTFIAQVADRVGLLLCGVASFLLDRVAGVVFHGLGPWISFVLIANFITSGILIWFLTKYYCTRKWNLQERRSNVIATAAAVFTNPAWAMGIVAIIPAYAGGQ